MNIFARIINLFRSRDKPINSSRSTNRFRHAVESSIGDWELATSEDIFAAVTRISNAFATVPCHLYKDRRIVNNHPMEWIVAHEPGPAWTPFTCQQTMEAYRNTEGNAYQLIVPNSNGGIGRLDILQPGRVTPMLNEESGELWYRLQADDGEFYIHNTQVIHTRHICTNGYKGIPPVRVLRNTLDYDAKIKKFSLSQLEGGVHSPIILEIPSEIDDGKKATLIERFLDAYRKSGGSLIVLDAGAKAARLTGSPVDAGVLESERITKNRVATVYNIPPHMLGDFGNSSYQTNEQSMLEFIQLTMQPIFTMYAQEYNKKLLTREERVDGFSFGFDADTLLMADTGTRADYNTKAIRSAGKTPNEIRRSAGDPDVPGGDRLMVSRDLVPLDLLDKLAESYEKSVMGGGNR